MEYKDIRVIKGMHDFLPKQSEKLRFIEQELSVVANSYAYSSIRTPILEFTELFERSVGINTDIVGKEMYSFTDKSSDSLSMRPEGTAGCTRMVINNHMLYDGPKRFYYYGPMFRRERPQKGRFREFNQFGVEAVGFPDENIDIEILCMSKLMWKRLGIYGELRLLINSIGTPQDRIKYKEDLELYFLKYKSMLSEEELVRLDSNPLRLLDSKNTVILELLHEAPNIIDYISKDSRLRFERVLKTLDALNIIYKLDNSLVRGLDYYSHTVFEWVCGDDNKHAVCAGGRYDDLFEYLGGKPSYGVGFAVGLERLMAIYNTDLENKPLIYLLANVEAANISVLRLSDAIRSNGFRAISAYNNNNISQNLKIANKSCAEFFIISGKDEIDRGVFSIKNLKNSDQRCLSYDEILNYLNEFKLV